MAQCKQKGLYFYLAPTADLRNLQIVFFMIVQKIEKELEVNHAKKEEIFKDVKFVFKLKNDIKYYKYINYCDAYIHFSVFISERDYGKELMYGG